MRVSPDNMDNGFSSVSVLCVLEREPCVVLLCVYGTKLKRQIETRSFN